MWFPVRNPALLAALMIAAGCSEREAAPDPKLVLGEKIYTANCKVCHAQGINGAPIPGNGKMWGPRAA